MSYRIAIVGFILLFAGCGISETKFGKDLAKLSCEKQNECSGSSNNCEAEEDSSSSSSEDEYECDYDKKKAKDCLDAVEAAECKEDGTYDFPDACSTVVVDCMPK